MLVSLVLSQLLQEISVQERQRMSFWPYALEFTRELRWFWPSHSCTGLSLSAVALLGSGCCLAGCCLGVVLTLLAVSSACRRAVQHLVWALLSSAASTQVPVTSPALRRRLGEYRSGA